MFGGNGGTGTCHLARKSGASKNCFGDCENPYFLEISLRMRLSDESVMPRLEAMIFSGTC